MSTLRITCDSGANLKILKRLEKAGLVIIHSVQLENGRENNVKNKILPIAVWNHSRWNEAVLAGDDCLYDDIREIIGKSHIEDAMHLEAHIRHGHDYFVTEDKDFLEKKSELENKFDIKIVTPIELDALCRAQRRSFY